MHFIFLAWLVSGEAFPPNVLRAQNEVSRSRSRLPKLIAQGWKKSSGQTYEEGF
jgi:hypothetical protein